MHSNVKPQQRYDLYSSTYNPGWRDNPNFKWGGGSNQGQASSSFQPQQQPKWGGGPNQSSNAYPSQQGYGTYQGRPNPNAQGYRPNQQAYVPPQFVKNDDLAHAPKNNLEKLMFLHLTLQILNKT